MIAILRNIYSCFIVFVAIVKAGKEDKWEEPHNVLIKHVR